MRTVPVVPVIALTAANLALRWIVDPFTALAGAGVEAAVIALIFACSGDRLRERRRFADQLLAGGARLVAPAATRDPSVGGTWLGSAVALAAGQRDRLDLWRQPFLGGGPELARSIRWTEVEAVEVGEVPAPRAARSVVARVRGGSPLPTALITVAALGRLIEPGPTAAALEHLRREAASEPPAPTGCALASSASG